MCYSESKALVTVHVLATALTIWPPYLHRNTSKALKIYRIYGLILLIFYVYVFWKVLVSTFDIFFKNNTSVFSGVMRFINYFVLGVLSVDANLRSFYIADDFNAMVAMLRKIDEGLSDSGVKGKRQTNLQLYVEFAVINLLMVVLMCSAFVFWLNSNTSLLKVLLYFQYYYYASAAFLLYIYAEGIAKQIKTLNCFLETYLLLENLKSGRGPKLGLRRIRNLYCSISQVIYAYNKVFGWRVFFHFAATFFGCIHLVNTVAPLFENSDTSKNIIETIHVITSTIARSLILGVSITLIYRLVTIVIWGCMFIIDSDF